MIENRYTQKKIAKKLGISYTSFSFKLHNKREFSASEIAIIMEILKINNLRDIFFANRVDENLL